MRPAGPHGAQLGEFDVAAQIDGNDQRVKGQDIAAGLRSAFGKQPVGGAVNVDGTGQDVAVMVRLREVGVGNEGGLLHGLALLSGRSVTAIGRCGERRSAARERWRAERGA
ncbi:hypothetical protein ACWDZ6_21555 [Streptomyces sp. NPDC002926]